MAEKAVVVGSGPGAATAAMVLAEAGWDVVVFEKGRNYFSDLTEPAPGTLFSNDELKMLRGFGGPDTEGEPRAFRSTADDPEPLEVGFVNNLPTTVGGGSAHWDAKVPRFWDIDFEKLTRLGPIDGADVVDWPVSYSEMAPYYDAVEQLIGVQGDGDGWAAVAGKYAPRSRAFPMPPGPAQLASLLLAEGAGATGLHPYSYPAAVASQPYDGRPACINCGFCSGFGCPIHDRGSALIPLRRALLSGRAELRPDSMVTRIEHDGSSATGVRWVGSDGAEHTESADFVVLGGGAVESPRLVLLSDVGDDSGWIGGGIMFHWFSDGFGIWLDQRLHGYRGRSFSHGLDDFCDPDFPGAREAAAEVGLPYLRGGILEMGGTSHLIQEALQYVDLMEIFDADKPFGRRFKELMRLSALRDRLAGMQMIAEDLCQQANRVDLDPSITDRYGLPAARVTYHPHLYELTAQQFYMPHMEALAKAAGADVSGAVAQTGTPQAPSPTGETTPSGAHLMGGLRMGTDPSNSATDGFGRLWSIQNVGVADAAVFPTSGAHNPTLTIFAIALRNARSWAGLEGPPELAVDDEGDRGADSGVPVGLVVAGAAGGAAVIAGGAAALAARKRRASAHGSETAEDGTADGSGPEPLSS
ncbi:MAG: 6'''-hydroxyparomomycin C oxidase [Acidimicrobiales bacterium]|nr:6'''-hydroxyparomomycin C oxidase [Acidimicrobiales bacterium]